MNKNFTFLTKNQSLLFHFIYFSYENICQTFIAFYWYIIWIHITPKNTTKNTRQMSTYNSYYFYHSFNLVGIFVICICIGITYTQQCFHIALKIWENDSLYFFHWERSMQANHTHHPFLFSWIFRKCESIQYVFTITCILYNTQIRIRIENRGSANRTKQHKHNERQRLYT